MLRAVPFLPMVLGCSVGDTERPIPPVSDSTSDSGSHNTDDGAAEPACLVEVWDDLDGDGYGVDGSQGFVDCASVEETATTGGDCDDADSSVHPGATEVCGDEIDEDCDGASPPCGFGGDYTIDDGTLLYASEYLDAQDAPALGWSIAAYEHPDTRDFELLVASYDAGPDDAT